MLLASHQDALVFDSWDWGEACCLIPIHESVCILIVESTLWHS